MTGLNSIGGSPLYGFLCTVSLALVIGQLNALIQAIRLRRKKSAVFIAFVNLLLGFFLFVIMMDCSQSRIVSAEDAELYQPFQWALFALPWTSYAGAEAVSVTVLILTILGNRNYLNTHLTPNAVRATIDLLPEGILISSEEGTVLLSNLRMNDLCRELTGRLLSDSDLFEERIKTSSEVQNGQYFVCLPRGDVWLFAKKRLTAEGKEYDQITAVDVTERYRITEELKRKNGHLQDLQRRMKAVSELSGDMFVAQEEANARAALHNQLGQVLLMGRHFLDHPENTDAEMVYLATKQMNAFLLGEYEGPVPKAEDLLQQSVAMAKSIGVTVELHGDITDLQSQRTILAHAVQESAANTVKHASGDRLTVNVSVDGNSISFVITNNGTPPKMAINESGGLLSLRREIEATGGTMTVFCRPAFSLLIQLPQQK